MADLLEVLTSRYDIVLIDSPPLLPVTDAAKHSRAVTSDPTQRRPAPDGAHRSPSASDESEAGVSNDSVFGSSPAPTQTGRSSEAPVSGGGDARQGTLQRSRSRAYSIFSTLLPLSAVDGRLPADVDKRMDGKTPLRTAQGPSVDSDTGDPQGRSSQPGAPTATPRATTRVLTRRRTQHRPAEPQRHHDVRPVRRGPRPARPHDLRLQPLPERPTSVVTVPTGRRAQLVQDRALLRPVRPLVTRRERLGHCLPLAHRKSHDRGLPAVRAPTRQAR
jgi:hypothetical protein